jgi:transcriptional regulator with XRE-family HTH domain
MDDLPVVAIRIRQARVRAGISQRLLGIKAGIGPDTAASARVNNYERGRSEPAFAVLERFSEVLSVPAAFFIVRDDVMAEIILRIGELSPKDRRILLRQLSISGESSGKMKRIRTRQ